MTIHRILILCLFFIFTLTSCQSDIDAPNVSEVSVSCVWHRFDQLLARTNQPHWADSCALYCENYPVFCDLYFNQILQIPGSIDSLHHFITQAFATAVLDSIDLQYADIADIQLEWEKAMKYYTYYFPMRDVPEVHTLFSSFSVGVFLFQNQDSADALGVGLDYFLGDHFPYGQLAARGVPGFSSYQNRTYNRDHLVKRMVQTLVQDIVPPPSDDRLLDQMIYFGKQLYLIDKILPFTSDTVVHEYTSSQLEWCKEYEAQMYTHFISNDLLYSRRLMDIRTYLYPAPSSAGMPAESPSRTGHYIGYQIVSSFMENNNYSIDQLLGMQDAQRVLTASKYKPTP